MPVRQRVISKLLVAVLVGLGVLAGLLAILFHPRG
jgi:hypothetical protein